MNKKTFAFPFEKRIAHLEQLAIPPTTEIAAAVNVYERLLTAKAIIQDTEGETGSDTALLVSVFEALCAESRAASE